MSSSSALTNLVPVLEGPNYQPWAPAMQSFLMSTGQWRCCGPVGPPKPILEEKVVTNQDKIDAWEDLNMKAVGNIRLRLHYNIQYKYREKTLASELWNELVTE